MFWHTTSAGGRSPQNWSPSVSFSAGVEVLSCSINREDELKENVESGGEGDVSVGGMKGGGKDDVAYGSMGDKPVTGWAEMGVIGWIMS